ncbi:uncharacterized protein N7484_000963 [Penicillium longicatenatum]|uniref:uncharacterized protein n=1 Tax=Penicillium longicatenatum TaxID=1561947 RepID=UPI002546A2DF|nr:uncharacterized protein N7484_000963 [Penicillium longicatenatum]KAJ5657314.1 hypothetical protein N7484_000963 [Penicillium longicatenatum]
MLPVVRCDRCDPCGNCQDADVACTRQRKERSRKKLNSRLEVIRGRGQLPWSPNQNTPELQHEAQKASFERQELRNAISYNPSLELDAAQFSRTIPSFVSPLPLLDAKFAIQFQLDHLPGLAINRREILESALRHAAQLSDSFEGQLQEPSDDNTSSGDEIPSLELLMWITSEMKSDKFGPFVKDYFRYISEDTLKRMSIDLVRKRVPKSEFAIGSVCVNSMGYKFLTSLMSLETDPEVIYEYRQKALQYRAAAKMALQRIPLVAAPSLGLLQAILSGIFLHQGTGDVTFCWELTRTACRACVDLGLDMTFSEGNALSEEEFYCLAWCYMLDKNYTFKLGRSVSLLNADFETNCFKLQVNRHSISENMLLNIELAKIQAVVIPYLGSRSLEMPTSIPSFHEVGGRLLIQMNQIQARIEKVACPSRLWQGLNAQSEVSALQFAYHSTRTMTLNLLQNCHEQSLGAHNLYLQSARQGLSSLMSMCLSAEKQSAVAFLHWTLLYYPIMAYFVLFCNVVATSDTNDFNLMKAIADLLSHSETSSRPIKQITTIFQHFVSLSQEVFDYEATALVKASNSQLKSQTHMTPQYPNANPSQWGCEVAESVITPPLLTQVEDYPEMIPLPMEDLFPLFTESFDHFTQRAGL